MPGSHDRILAGTVGKTLFIRIMGRGTFKVSAGLKQFCVNHIEKGFYAMVLDFEECAGMDSTFMGVVAGLSSRLGGGKGPITAINLSPKTMSLLETLGLDQVLQCYQRGENPPQIKVSGKKSKLSELDQGGESELERAEVMLEAHEELVDLSPENLPKFKDVLAFLQEDIQGLREQGGDK